MGPIATVEKGQVEGTVAYGTSAGFSLLKCLIWRSGVKGTAYAFTVVIACWNSIRRRIEIRCLGFRIVRSTQIETSSKA
jgi:hypothetical protein